METEKLCNLSHQPMLGRTALTRGEHRSVMGCIRLKIFNPFQSVGEILLAQFHPIKLSYRFGWISVKRFKRVKQLGSFGLDDQWVKTGFLARQVL
jgi:hypothetical protein